MNSSSTSKTNLNVELIINAVVAEREPLPDISGTISVDSFLSTSSSAALFLQPSSLGGLQSSLLSGIPRVPRMNTGPQGQNPNPNRHFTFSTFSSANNQKREVINRLLSLKLNSFFEKTANPQRLSPTNNVGGPSSSIFGQKFLLLLFFSSVDMDQNCSIVFIPLHRV